jgi:hypothetical protein
MRRDCRIGTMRLPGPMFQSQERDRSVWSSRLRDPTWLPHVSDTFPTFSVNAILLLKKVEQLLKKKKKKK